MPSIGTLASVTIPVITEAEANVLALYDQLQQLELEAALLQSRQGHPLPSHDSSGNQTQVLEAKATLALRNSVVDNVVVVQPTLNAVHQATETSVVERALLPINQERDAAVTRTTKTCAELQTLRSRLAELEIQVLHVSHQNTKLASEALQLAGKMADQALETGGNTKSQSELATLESQVKASQHRWRVMKGVTSAVVTGSGVDWAREEQFKELVLDSSNC
ncbi:centromere protein H (CENP-H)-domain-containing protein [Dichotomopilus funicola]|uniref:Centromere protein H (CENP-H)-domain-containing protein n=1 Tax=Dichotomopilus funicola TaxID=1934379 RepID=A0AAN6V531_9PEZI|nr:centromere protein H (CENP-H)-domain-containing protein [Dichotomopilus funicola]